MSRTLPAQPGSWSRALVTGASSGIGRSLARELAAQGTDVVLVARSDQALRTLAADLEATYGVWAEVLVADLSTPDGLARTAARLAAEPPVDLLVNNAGVGTLGRFDESDMASEFAVVDLNVVAPLHLTRSALPAMKARGRGTVLTVSSLVAAQPMPLQATYAASKAFVNSFFEALHEEMRRTPVSITTVMPGLVRTEFKNHVGVEGAFEQVPDWAWADPDDVARAALQAAARDRAVVVHGLSNRLVAAMTPLTPRRLRRRIARRFGEFL